MSLTMTIVMLALSIFILLPNDVVLSIPTSSTEVPSHGEDTTTDLPSTNSLSPTTIFPESESPIPSEGSQTPNPWSMPTSSTEAPSQGEDTATGLPSTNSLSPEPSSSSEQSSTASAATSWPDPSAVPTEQPPWDSTGLPSTNSPLPNATSSTPAWSPPNSTESPVPSAESKMPEPSKSAEQPSMVPSSAPPPTPPSSSSPPATSTSIPPTSSATQGHGQRNRDDEKETYDSADEGNDNNNNNAGPRSSSGSDHEAEEPRRIGLPSRSVAGGISLFAMATMLTIAFLKRRNNHRASRHRRIYGGETEMGDLSFADGEFDMHRGNEGLLDESAATLLLRSVLHGLGIPDYGMDKYEQILHDNGLREVEQLQVLDGNDWKRLNFPMSVQTALRDRLARLEV